MASYEETGGRDPMLSLAMEVAPFIGASIYRGQEARMAKHVAGVYSRHLGKIPKSQLAALKNQKWLAKRMAAERMSGALNIAEKQGVLKASAWATAKNSGVRRQLAKVALSRAAGLFMVGFEVSWFAPLLYSGARGAFNTLRTIGKDARGLDFGGQYSDSRGAYTERQRSLRAITSSRMSTRAALGNEALLMHR